MKSLVKVGALHLLLLLTVVACEDVRQDEPSEDGTCYPAYNQDGEPERGAAGQECYS